ncbi:hypothetical protein N0V90_001853 [Kalmusia sp. IMI 367209]|nr:hypothetical protein N0V90_001853 [Kalmusia sp. IMI 367209]
MTSFRFLGLPKELRLMIYEHLTVETRHVKDGGLTLVHRTLSGVGILATNHLINHEAGGILYPRLYSIISIAPQIIISSADESGLLSVFDSDYDSEDMSTASKAIFELIKLAYSNASRYTRSPLDKERLHRSRFGIVNQENASLSFLRQASMSLGYNVIGHQFRLQGLGSQSESGTNQLFVRIAITLPAHRKSNSHEWSRRLFDFLHYLELRWRGDFTEVMDSDDYFEVQFVAPTEDHVNENGISVTIGFLDACVEKETDFAYRVHEHEFLRMKETISEELWETEWAEGE